jgi:hypothetical protein
VYALLNSITTASTLLYIYLGMKGNYTLDPERYTQVEYLLDILSENETVFNTVSNGIEANMTHPAVTCQLIDKLVIEINSKHYWTRSSLARHLETAVQKQWRPIIADNRRALQVINYAI